MGQEYENEIWKDISGYEGLYQVSNLGRVKSFRLHKISILKNIIQKEGYIRVVFTVKSAHKSFFVHRLVAQAFIPNPENKPEVNHIDGDKTNNRVENLEWCTARENQIHSYNIGLQISQKGENHGCSKFRNEDIYNIVKLYAEGYTQKEIAGMYNTNQSHISEITSGKQWSHITGIKYTKSKRLPKDKVLEIFDLINSSYRNCEISKKVGVSEDIISSIRVGRRHSKITGIKYVKE